MSVMLVMKKHPVCYASNHFLKKKRNYPSLKFLWTDKIWYITIKRHFIFLHHILFIDSSKISHWCDMILQFSLSFHHYLFCNVLSLTLSFGWQVTACSRCNNRKGQKILEEANMKLNKIPKVIVCFPHQWSHQKL